ncbi:hypothetical protein CBM2629_B60018 [Cupriavidus taiwanensis]|nr:hypothetical protein CBM2629_B60018 [Cupriavidus taiwanensis]
MNLCFSGPPCLGHRLAIVQLCLDEAGHSTGCTPLHAVCRSDCKVRRYGPATSRVLQTTS